MTPAERWRKRKALLLYELQTADTRVISDLLSGVVYDDLEEEIIYAPKGTSEGRAKSTAKVVYDDVLSAFRKIMPEAFAKSMKLLTDANDGKIPYQGELKFYNTETLLSCGITQVDEMSDIEFEHFAADMFEALGYNSRVTQKSSDFGVDVIARTFLFNVGIQCKHLSDGVVGVEAVQEIVAGKTFYDLDKAVVITNKYFTNQAKMLANKNHVTLLDRAWIKEALKGISEKK